MRNPAPLLPPSTKGGDTREPLVNKGQKREKCGLLTRASGVRVPHGPPDQGLPHDVASLLLPCYSYGLLTGRQ